MWSSSVRPLNAIAALLIPFCASASEMSCDSLPELQQLDMSGCECGSSLAKLPIVAPRGMSLIAACGFKNEEFVGIVGKFYFKGNARVAGTVRHSKPPSRNSTLEFVANTPGRPIPFLNATRSLKFADESSESERFGAPPALEDGACASAQTLLNVKLLYVNASYDESEEGNFPKDYDVLKVGPFEVCELQVEDTAED